MAKRANEEVLARRVLIGLFSTVFVVGAGAYWLPMLSEGRDASAAKRTPHQERRVEVVRSDSGSGASAMAATAATAVSGGRASTSAATSVASSAVATIAFETTPSGIAEVSLPSAQENSEPMLPSPLDRYIPQASNPQSLLESIRRLSGAANKPEQDQPMPGKVVAALGFGSTRHDRRLTFAFSSTHTELFAKLPSNLLPTKDVLVDIGDLSAPTVRERLFFSSWQDDGTLASFALNDKVQPLPKGAYLVRVYAPTDHLPLIAAGELTVKD